MTDYSARFRTANLQQLQQVCALYAEALERVFVCYENGGHRSWFRRRLDAILSTPADTDEKPLPPQYKRGPCGFGLLRPDGGCKQPFGHDGPCDGEPTCKPDLQVQPDRVIRSGDLVVGRRYREPDWPAVFVCSRDNLPSRGEICRYRSASGWLTVDDTGSAGYVPAVELVEDEAEQPKCAREPDCVKPRGHAEHCMKANGEIILRRKPDPTIIHAAEGVVLEPGEYEIVKLDPDDAFPAHSVGQRFVIDEPLPCVDDDSWVIGNGAQLTEVSAVRRVEPRAPQESSLAGQHIGDGHIEPELGDYDDSPQPAQPAGEAICGKLSRSGRMHCTEPPGHDGMCADHGDGFATADEPAGEAQPEGKCANPVCDNGRVPSGIAATRAFVDCPDCKGTGRVGVGDVGESEADCEFSHEEMRGWFGRNNQRELTITRAQALQLLSHYDSASHESSKQLQKSRIYGELAAKWRNRCIAGGLAKPDERIEATEYSALLEENASLRERLEAAEAGKARERECANEWLAQKHDAEKRAEQAERECAELKSKVESLTVDCESYLDERDDAFEKLAAYEREAKASALPEHVRRKNAQKENQ